MGCGVRNQMSSRQNSESGDRNHSSEKRNQEDKRNWKKVKV